jgi:hypothetical protein
MVLLVSSVSDLASVGEIVELSTILSVAWCASCQCQSLELLFEHLFEYPQEGLRRVKMSVPEVAPAHDVISDGAATPIEFTFRGKRCRIHAVLAPIGALNTFQLERDEITGSWIVKQV